jgi:serine/threonine-protein phosphatase 2A regulatory subunit B
VRSDVFLYSSSKGFTNICDLRLNSHSESFSTTFKIYEDPSRKHFFTEMINSVSSAKFSPVNPNFIFSRDYIAVHIWDVRNNKAPVRSYSVTDYLEKKLCEVYESELIFDKFDL